MNLKTVLFLLTAFPFCTTVVLSGEEDPLQQNVTYVEKKHELKQSKAESGPGGDFPSALNLPNEKLDGLEQVNWNANLQKKKGAAAKKKPTPGKKTPGKKKAAAKKKSKARKPKSPPKSTKSPPPPKKIPLPPPEDEEAEEDPGAIDKGDTDTGEINLGEADAETRRRLIQKHDKCIDTDH